MDEESASDADVLGSRGVPTLEWRILLYFDL